MVAEVITGLGIFKSLLDSAKGLKDMNDAAVRNAAVIELQTQILGAQEQQSQLLHQCRELEAELNGLKSIREEKRRYKLKDYGGKTFAYELRDEAAEEGEPSHRLCPNCYQKDKFSILQFSSHSCEQDHYDCPACKAHYAFGVFVHKPPPEPMRSDFF